jgi:hypothetical protein
MRRLGLHLLTIAACNSNRLRDRMARPPGTFLKRRSIELIGRQRSRTGDRLFWDHG